MLLFFLFNNTECSKRIPDKSNAYLANKTKRETQINIY